VLGSGAAFDSNQQALQQTQQQQQQLRLHVGIAKVALMAKEKGFRSSMRDTQSAMMLASQVRSACKLCNCSAAEARISSAELGGMQEF
jgi:hypothetical protein